MWNFSRLDILIAMAMCLCLSPDLNGGELESGTPKSVDIHFDKLRELSEWVRGEQLDVRSMIVVRDGKFALECNSRRCEPCAQP